MKGSPPKRVSRIIDALTYFTDFPDDHPLSTQVEQFVEQLLRCRDDSRIASILGCRQDQIDETLASFTKWAQSIGDDVAEMIRIVLKKRKHPEQAFKTCMGILNLVKQYEPDRLNKACGRALEFGFYSYKRIKSILDKGLEEEPLAESRELTVSSHENIRGSQYYQ